jgi:hypothetical protein
MAALGSGALSAAGAGGRASETVVLRQLAAEKGLTFGTTISAKQIETDRSFVGLVLRQGGLVVAETK